MSGIYLITHLNSTKIYVGSSIDIAKRWRVHVQTLNAGRHHNPHLQNAWNEDGEDSFKFEIIEKLPIRLLTEREQFWMDAYDVINEGYNIFPTARSALGSKKSASARLKMSIKKQNCFKGSDNPNFGKKATVYCKSQQLKATGKRYELTKPDGSREIILGLKLYCRVNKLDSRSMFRLLKGEKKYYKNYKIKYYE